MKRSVICFLLFLTIPLNSQIKNFGTYHIMNYSITNNEMLATTNAIIQDSIGIMYFGTNKGITTFDGNNWELITLPNNSCVLSLTIDIDGTIYAGAMDEFGYLKPDVHGKLTYFSLVNKLKQEFRGMGNVIGVASYPEGVLFVTNNILILYDRNTCNVIESYSNYGQTTHFEGKLLIEKEKKSFVFYKDGKLHNFTTAKELDYLNTKAFVELQPYHCLAVDNEKGCFQVTAQKLIPIKVSFRDFAIKNKIISSLKLKKGFTVLGSLNNGAIIIDSRGIVIQHLNKYNGLENNRITALYEDVYGNLWIGHDMGVSYVEISSPFTYIVANGEGSGFSAKVFKEKLYLGTSQELFVLPWNKNNTTLFPHQKIEKVTNITGQVYNLNVINNVLYACNNSGTYIIEGTNAKKIESRMGTWDFKPYSYMQDIYLQGSYSGFNIYAKVNGKLQYKNLIEGFYKSTRVFEIDNRDYIWVTHGYEGVYRLQMNLYNEKVVNFKFYGKDNGFPSNLGINAYRIKNKILFTSEHGGIYEYNTEKDSFLLYTGFEEFLGKYPKLSKLYEDNDGNIWFIELDRTGVLLNKGNGRYRILEKPFSGLSKSQIRGFELIYPIDNRNVILGTNYGFLHYDPQNQKQYDVSYHALIRKIEIIAQKDSIVYSGHKQEKNSKQTDFRHKYNSLRFSYVAPFFESPENLKFSCYLEGFDKGWSEWTLKMEREYTNLPGGDYVFHVKAKNIYNNESKEDVYYFHVHPPFTRTWIAYLMYLIFFIGLVIGLAYIYSRKKVNRYKKDSLIKEREIINLKNQQLNSEIEFKNKELGSMTMQIIKRNEMMLNIKNKLDENYTKFSPEVKNAVDIIIRSIENEVNTEKDWEFIKTNFDSVYIGFLKRLKELFPELKSTELQLCAYIRMGLSNKEIATLMNSTYRGIEGYRYRLRKNLNLEHDENIKDFLFNLLD